MSHVIAHLIATNFYGGPEKQIVEHLCRLDGKRYQGVVVSFLEGEKNEILQKAGGVKVPHHAIAMTGPLDFRAQRGLSRFLKEYQVDLLCTHGYKATIMGWWAGRCTQIPVLSFSRGYTAEDKKVAFYEWLDRQTLKRVDGVIAVSEGQRQRLASFGVYGKKNWVVHNAVVVPPQDKEAQRSAKKAICSRFDLHPDARLVVAAGRLSPEKGHRFLVEAVGLLAGKIEKTFFFFCGDGPCYTALVEQAKVLGVADACLFPGFQRNIGEFFQAMDLMVLPSLTEGLPNVILEAFALAKPVVSTRVGGVPELVIDGENGYMVEKERPDLLAAAIVRSLDDPEKMHAMGQRGYERVQADFSFEEQAATLEGIYKSLLKED